MTARTWWAPPRLRTDEPGTEPRRVTWLELFYDLVFVIVIGQLSHRLSGGITPAGVWEFVFLFVPVWWIWAAGTYYVEYWETEDLSIRWILFLLMLPVVGIATSLHDALAGSAAPYALSYAAARVLLAGLFFRVGVHSRISRTIAWSYAAGFAAIAVMVAFSAFVPRPTRIALWITAVAVELLMPIAISGSVRRLLPHRRETSKLPERFGLFTIIVLGETIVGVFYGLSRAHSVSFAILGVGVLGLALVFELWSIYFDGIARRRVKPGIGWEFVWGYAHLLLLMGIVGIGASIGPVVESGEARLPAGAKWLLLGSTAVSLVVLGVLESALEPESRRFRNATASAGVKIAAGLLALAPGLHAGSISAAGLLGTLVALLLAPVLFELRVWARERAA